MAVLFAPGVTSGQPPAETRVPILTVCEVLADHERYAAHPVAVVGRLQSIVGVIDGYDFLAQDKCERPIRRDNRTLPNKMLVGFYPDEWMPQPPTDRPSLDFSGVRDKLIKVQRTTRLGFHKEYGFSGARRVPNTWAVIYGRIVSPPKPGQKGYNPGPQHFLSDAPLVILTKPYNMHILDAGGTLVHAPEDEPQ
ncbi:MAG TPA: hypothetical protein VFA04_04595 [Bryobacteraceae bacterium]|nr:hypothetical protein [Bryobacteraceae bacterium]